MHDRVYSAVAVANEFLRRARESRIVLSATQVHELVYCAHGWHLVVAGHALISGPVAAHRGGVYIPDLRIAGCWGNRPLEGLLPSIQDQTLFPRLDAGSPIQFTIDHAWDDYGPLSRYDLTRFTLAENGPWDQVWNTDSQHESLLIPNRLLRDWFGQVATWRTAVDHVSLAVDRVMQEPPRAGRLAVDRPVTTARPAENDAIALDRSLLRDLRSNRLSYR